eukprot:s281_g26.t1
MNALATACKQHDEQVGKFNEELGALRVRTSVRHCYLGSGFMAAPLAATAQHYCDPCVFFATKTGCRNGDQCKFCHIHRFSKLCDDELCPKARPKKDRRQRIERRIFELMVSVDNYEKLIEGLQEEARRHPYERFVIKGVLDRCLPVPTVSGGVALRL